MDRQDLINRIVRYADAQGAPRTPFLTEVDGLAVVRCREKTPLEAQCYSPFLCVVLQGKKTSYLGRQRVTYAAGQSLIVSLSLPSVARIVEASEDAPYVALAVELDLGIVRSLYEEAGEASFASAEGKAIVAGAADDAMFDAMGRLFGLVERPRERAVMLPLLRREIHFRALMARHGTMLRGLARRDSHASRIVRVLGTIRDRYAEPLRVADLADAAGMSVSSFHEHFKAVTASTPLQYQKDLRLLEAREMLIQGALSVSTIAFDVGYESPTQFSREYARKFGTPPSAERRNATQVA